MKTFTPLRFEFHDPSGLRFFLGLDPPADEVVVSFSKAEESPREEIARIPVKEIHDQATALRGLSERISGGNRAAGPEHLPGRIVLGKGPDDEISIRGTSVVLAEPGKTLSLLASTLEEYEPDRDDSGQADPDAIIIGGGPAGLASMLSLQERGLRTLLVDDGGPGALSFSAGKLIAPSSLQQFRGLPGEINLHATRAWLDGYGDSYEIKKSRRGQLLLATDKTSVKALEEKLEVLKDVYPSTLIGLNPGDPGHGLIGPLMKRDTVLAAWQPDFLSVDPREMRRSVMARAGGDRIEARATGLIVEDGRAVGVRTTSGDLFAEVIVAATGCGWEWLSEDLRPPVQPVGGAMLMLGLDEPWGEEPTIWTPTGSIVPMEGERVWIGVSENPGDPVGFPLLEDIARITANAVRTCPRLGSARVLEARAGVRPGSPDGLPIYGQGNLPGLFLAAGAGRAGVLQMPVAGEILAAAVCSEEHPFAEACSPQRFAD